MISSPLIGEILGDARTPAGLCRALQEGFVLGPRGVWKGVRYTCALGSSAGLAMPTYEGGGLLYVVGAASIDVEI